MPDEKTPEKSELEGGSKTPNGSVASLAELSPELQSELTKLLTRKEKEWEKKHSDTFTKATEFEKLQEVIKQQKDAELTETEKLRKRIAELEPYESQSKEYETELSERVEARRAQVPADKQSLVPVGLSNVQLSKWFDANEKLLFGTERPAAPDGGKPPSGAGDKLRERADAQVKEMYPRVPADSPDFKAKSDRIYKRLKDAGVTQ